MLLKSCTLNPKIDWINIYNYSKLTNISQSYIDNHNILITIDIIYHYFKSQQQVIKEKSISIYSIIYIYTETVL